MEIAAYLGLSPRTIVALCRNWIAKGLLQANDFSRKNRSYRLAPEFEALITHEPRLGRHLDLQNTLARSHVQLENLRPPNNRLPDLFPE